MKTPLRPGLDDEIYEVEERISRRRERIPEVAKRAADVGPGAIEVVVGDEHGLALAVVAAAA